MFLRFCFGIVAFISIFFTISYCNTYKINDKILIGLVIFELIVFIAIEHHIWILD